MAIIGVVATLTLPMLLNRLSEQRAKTTYRKIINTLSNAGNMNVAMDGFDYSVPAGTLNDRISNGDYTLGALFNERLQVNRNASHAFGNTGYCRTEPVFILIDGTAICPYRYYENGQYWLFAVDINGPKGPNRASVCEDQDCNKCRMYDQFAVTLHRTSVIAGKWSSVGVEKDDKYTRAAKFAMGLIK